MKTGSGRLSRPHRIEPLGQGRNALSSAATRSSSEMVARGMLSGSASPPSPSSCSQRASFWPGSALEAADELAAGQQSAAPASPRRPRSTRTGAAARRLPLELPWGVCGPRSISTASSEISLRRARAPRRAGAETHRAAAGAARAAGPALPVEPSSACRIVGPSSSTTGSRFVDRLQREAQRVQRQRVTSGVGAAFRSGTRAPRISTASASTPEDRLPRVSQGTSSLARAAFDRSIRESRRARAPPHGGHRPGPLVASTCWVSTASSEARGVPGWGTTGDNAVRLAGGYHHHLAFNSGSPLAARRSRTASRPAPRGDPLPHARRARRMRWRLRRGRLADQADDGPRGRICRSTADPDGNGLELQWTAPFEEWPRDERSPRRAGRRSRPRRAAPRAARGAADEMTIGASDALLLLALLAVAAGLLAVAQRTRIPYPILLVLGGLVLALIPGLPHPRLDPKLVLIGILRRSSTRRRSTPRSGSFGGTSAPSHRSRSAS